MYNKYIFIVNTYKHDDNYQLIRSNDISQLRITYAALCRQELSFYAESKSLDEFIEDYIWLINLISVLFD